MTSAFKFIHFDEIESTNKKMQDDANEGSSILNHVYYSDFQTSGRGTASNTWHSEQKKNVLFSVAIKPENLVPAQQFMLTKAISLALLDACSLYLNADDLKIKWPNDIYFKNSKLAGILISNTINSNEFEFSIIGVGLNVNQLSFPQEIPNPVSLAQITGNQYDTLEIMNNILLAINDRLIQLKDFELHHFISFEYLSNLFQLELWEDYRIENNIQKARILGVNNYGQLILEGANGITQNCDLKEVEFIINHG